MAHCAAYFTLASLLLWGLRRSHRLGAGPALWSMLLCCGYGIALEVVQYTFFPDRFFEVRDIIANIIGSFASVLVYLLIK